MGIKILSSLQMLLPWYCFHLPLPSSRTPATPPSSATIRLIAADGRVKVFSRPVPASELMRQHPLHLVCRSDSFFIGQKVPALSASDHLQPGHSYFLLPSHFFHSVLSFVTLSASLIKKGGGGGGGGGSAVLRSFDIRKTEKGVLQVRVRDEMIVDKSELAESEEEGTSKRQLRICGSEELEKEYKQIVGCRLRQWKPRLETITETTSSKRRRRSVLLLMIKKSKKKVQC